MVQQGAILDLGLKTPMTHNSCIMCMTHHVMEWSCLLMPVLINNAPCCPTNKAMIIVSHFINYEIQDSWLTNETRIKINDGDEDTSMCK